MMLGGLNLPQTPFDVRPGNYETPGIGDGVNQPPEPFIWGAGGARLTPEQILAREDAARDQMRSDFSPVGHWTQGLGRALDNVTGALDAKRLDKESMAANADRDAMIAQMLGPENADLAGAVSSGDRVVAGLAGDIMERRSPKPQQPNEFQQYLIAGGVLPGTPEYANLNRQRAETLYDPTVNANVGGRDFFGPRSMLLENLGKGGDPQISTAPGAVGSAAPASGGQGFMTFDQYRSMSAGTDFGNWQGRFGTPVKLDSEAQFNAIPKGVRYIGPDNVVRVK